MYILYTSTLNICTISVNIIGTAVESYEIDATNETCTLLTSLPDSLVVSAMMMMMRLPTATVNNHAAVSNDFIDLGA